MDRTRVHRHATALLLVAIVSASCRSKPATRRVRATPSATATAVALAPEATTAPTADPHVVAIMRAIREQLVTPTGGVRSWLRDARQEDPSENGVGHERLSESAGMLMAASLAAGQRDLFDLVHGYYLRHMRDPNGLAYWKLDTSDRPVRSQDGYYSEAPNDELRIARALSSAGVSDEARTSGTAVRAALRDGLLSDDVSWKPGVAPSAGEFTYTSYLDVEAMRTLGWQETDANLRALRGAVRPGRPPATILENGAYRCDGSCGTIDGLWVGLRLAAAGDLDPARTVATFYLGRLSADGRLAGGYEPTSPDEDVASYAMLARLAVRVGDRARAEAIVKDRLPKGPAGLYSFEADDASAFDNLEVALTFLELAGRRATAE